jgi:hypothetical protein
MLKKLKKTKHATLSICIRWPPATVRTWASRLLWQWHGEWQWLGGSGTNRQRRSVRFEWWWLECGSDSIGRVTHQNPSKTAFYQFNHILTIFLPLLSYSYHIFGIFNHKPYFIIFHHILPCFKHIFTLFHHILSYFHHIFAILVLFPPNLIVILSFFCHKRALCLSSLL